MHTLTSLKPQQEGFEPSVDFIAEDECDTIILFVPGFDKKLIKVQVTTNRKLTVSGHGPYLEGNLRSFQKEFQISENCEIYGITAIFDNDILYIRQPKVITAVAAEQEQDHGKQNNVQPTPETNLDPEYESIQHSTISPESDYNDSLSGDAAKKGDEKYKYYNQVLTGWAIEMKHRRKMYSFYVVVLVSALLFTLCEATCELCQV